MRWMVKQHIIAILADKVAGYALVPREHYCMALTRRCKLPRVQPYQRELASKDMFSYDARSILKQLEVVLECPGFATHDLAELHRAI